MAKEQHPAPRSAPPAAELTAEQLLFARRRAHAIALRFKMQRGDADDIAQDVVIKVMTAAPKLHDVDDAIRGAWLRRITRNRIYDLLRGTSKHRDAEPRVTAAETLLRPRPPRPDIALANAEARDARLRVRKLANVDERVLRIVERVNDNSCSRADAATELQRPIAGQYVDAGNVYNNGWRIYVPEIGLFTSPDPLFAETSEASVGAQGYTYAVGSPFTHVDPSGERDITVTADPWKFYWNRAPHSFSEGESASGSENPKGVIYVPPPPNTVPTSSHVGQYNPKDPQQHADFLSYCKITAGRDTGPGNKYYCQRLIIHLSQCTGTETGEDQWNCECMNHQADEDKCRESRSDTLPELHH